MVQLLKWAQAHLDKAEMLVLKPDLDRAIEMAHEVCGRLVDEARVFTLGPMYDCQVRAFTCAGVALNRRNREDDIARSISCLNVAYALTSPIVGRRSNWHYMHSSSCGELATAYALSGDIERAVPLFQECIDLLTNLAGIGDECRSWRLGQTYAGLAGALETGNRFAEAAAAWTAVVKIAERIGLVYGKDGASNKSERWIRFRLLRALEKSGVCFDDALARSGLGDRDLDAVYKSLDNDEPLDVMEVFRVPLRTGNPQKAAKDGRDDRTVHLSRKERRLHLQGRR